MDVRKIWIPLLITAVAAGLLGAASFFDLFDDIGGIFNKAVETIKVFFENLWTESKEVFDSVIGPALAPPAKEESGKETAEPGKKIVITPEGKLEIQDASRTHAFSLPRMPFFRIPERGLGEEPITVIRFIDRIIYEILNIARPCPICPPEPNTCDLKLRAPFSDPAEAFSNLANRATTDSQGRYALFYDCRGDAAGSAGCAINARKFSGNQTANFIAGEKIIGKGTVNLSLKCDTDTLEYQILDKNGDVCVNFSELSVSRSSDFQCPKPPPPQPPPPSTAPTQTIPTQPAVLSQSGFSFFRPSDTVIPGSQIGPSIPRSAFTQFKARLRIAIGVANGPLLTSEQLKLQYGIGWVRYSGSGFNLTRISLPLCQFTIWRDLPALSISPFMGSAISFDTSMPAANGTKLTSSHVGGAPQALAKRNNFQAVSVITVAGAGEWDFPIYLSGIIPTGADTDKLKEITKFETPGAYSYKPGACFRAVRASDQLLENYPVGYPSIYP